MDPEAGSRARLRLRPTSWRLAVCRFPPDAPLPAWVFHREAEFYSLTRTPRELSIVCAEDDLPPSVEHVERDWRAFEVVGPLPFTLTGVVSGLTSPLAAAGIPVFVISTHDTDYLLVKSADFLKAFATLAGSFDIVDEAPPI